MSIGTDSQAERLKSWVDSNGLPYHSSHKFRHGHIHYGVAKAKTIEDFKAVSMNILHSNMEIADQFYSNLSDNEIQDRISCWRIARTRTA